MITKCKGCNADINWIKTNEKAIPLNTNFKLVYVESVMPGEWKLVKGYESHFATCPNAKDFRKEK